MNTNTTAQLLSTMASGVYSTRDVIQITGHSPNTIIGYLKGMEDQGLIERVQGRRFGPGRPPIVHRVTPHGMEQWRSLETSAFLQLRKAAGAIWGPRRSFSLWGVPLIGPSDIFLRAIADTKLFEMVLEKNPAIYGRPLERPDGAYPRLEALIAWAAGGKNPRYLAAASVLLSRSDLDVRALRELSQRFRTMNRVGFLASLAGAHGVTAHLQPEDKWQRMLPEAAPVDDVTAKAARTWHVRNPLSSI